MRMRQLLQHGMADLVGIQPRRSAEELISEVVIERDTGKVRNCKCLELLSVQFISLDSLHCRAICGGEIEDIF